MNKCLLMIITLVLSNLITLHTAYAIFLFPDLISPDYSISLTSDKTAGECSSSGLILCDYIPFRFPVSAYNALLQHPILQAYSQGEDPFMFIDIHKNNEPYYATSDAVQPGFLFAIGSSMIVLAMIGRRIFH
jgi:hypothetical protein